MVVLALLRNILSVLLLAYRGQLKLLLNKIFMSLGASLNIYVVGRVIERQHVFI